MADTLWAHLEHGGSRQAFLSINLVLGGVAALAGMLIIGRGQWGKKSQINV